MVPIAPVSLGLWRRWALWVCAAAPAAVYVAFVLATGAGADAWAQLTSRVGLAQVGVIAYATQWFLFGGVVLGWLAAWLAGREAPLARALGALALLGVPVGFMAVIAQWGLFHVPSFVLFGAVLGAALSTVHRPQSHVQPQRAGGQVGGGGVRGALAVGYK